jgi:hypothetical protein
VTRACEPLAYTGWLRPEANDVRLLFGAGNVRRDDVHVVPATTSFAREEMHVLADAAEMRIVVLGHQRNAQRSLVVGQLERGELRKRGVITS